MKSRYPFALLAVVLILTGCDSSANEEIETQGLTEEQALVEVQQRGTLYYDLAAEESPTKTRLSIYANSQEQADQRLAKWASRGDMRPPGYKDHMTREEIHALWEKRMRAWEEEARNQQRRQPGTGSKIVSDVSTGDAIWNLYGILGYDYTFDVYDLQIDVDYSSPPGSAYYFTDICYFVHEYDISEDDAQGQCEWNCFTAFSYSSHNMALQTELDFGLPYYTQQRFGFTNWMKRLSTGAIVNAAQYGYWPGHLVR